MNVRMDVREGHRRRSAGPSPAAGRGQGPATAGPARSLSRPAEWEGLGGAFRRNPRVGGNRSRTGSGIKGGQAPMHLPPIPPPPRQRGTAQQRLDPLHQTAGNGATGYLPAGMDEIHRIQPAPERPALVQNPPALADLLDEHQGQPSAASLRSPGARAAAWEGPPSRGPSGTQELVGALRPPAAAGAPAGAPAADPAPPPATGTARSPASPPPPGS